MQNETSTNSSSGDSRPRDPNDWQTPEWFLDRVRKVAPIGLDPCTTPDNPTRALRFIAPPDDGLCVSWFDRLKYKDELVFVNPPYGRGHMGPWSQKIIEEASRGVVILALVRGDTSTTWAHELLRWATEVCFPKRIRFKGATGSPNFANMVLWYDHANLWPMHRVFEEVFADLGPIR